jgi:electron transport complex protein RnfB
MRFANSEKENEMTDDIYDQLADALDKLPNGFPRTPSNVEVRILKKIIAPEEAALVVQLRGQMEPIDVIAARLGVPVSEAMGKMIQMARRGLAWYEKIAGKHSFRLAPFVVGIYEAQLDKMDHELAHLVEEYMATGGAVGMMSPQPALHRVVPAQSAVKTEWILPYDWPPRRFASATASAGRSRNTSTTRAAFPRGSASTFPH